MKIKIHALTYLLILISFLAGYFDYTFLCLITIIIHEMGHYILAVILNIKVKEIEIFLIGGVTKLESDLNTKIYKEIIVLLAGPLFQILFLLIIYVLHRSGLVSYIVFNKVLKINITLLKINLLPIVPLDGGRLINNILDVIFSYKTSFYITIIISLITSPLLFIIVNKLVALVLFIFIIINIIDEIKGINKKLNKLIMERKIKNYNYKKTTYINNINKVKRNKNYVIYKIQNPYI